MSALERVMNKHGAEIEAPCRRLLDRDTGKPREHDVVITWDHGHHKIVTAIECRDRSRPVGVPDVEAFADKCAATGVQSGVIVSATGFRHTARKKAEARNIVCMELSEAERFNWLGTATITGRTRSISAVRFRLDLPVDLPRDAYEQGIFTESGRSVKIENLAHIAASHIPTGPMPGERVGEENTALVMLETKGWTVVGPDGREHKFDRISAAVTSELIETDVPITTHRYTGNGKNYAVASAEIPFPHLPGRVVMIENEDKSTTIYLVPEDRSDVTAS